MGILSEVVSQEPYADIAFVARLGFLADPATAPPKPLYLKAPDAKAQTNGRIPRAPGSGA